MDDTTSIVPIPLSSNSDLNNEDDGSNHDTHKIKKASNKIAIPQKTIFDDTELLKIISKENGGRSKLFINKNTKIRTNLTVTINIDSKNQRNDQNCDELPCPDNFNPGDNKKGNYLFSLDNLKKNKIITKEDMAQQNINGASMNNLNVIENKNNVNHVQNLFKKQVEEKNNNLIFDNHFMISGVA